DKTPRGRETLRTITAEWMIEAAGRGVGRDEDPGDLRIEIEVEDVLGELANVTVRSVVYTEYLHLARTSDGWKIVNDLWQQTPGSVSGAMKWVDFYGGDGDACEGGDPRPVRAAGGAAAERRRTASSQGRRSPGARLRDDGDSQRLRSPQRGVLRQPVLHWDLQ